MGLMEWDSDFEDVTEESQVQLPQGTVSIEELQAIATRCSNYILLKDFYGDVIEKHLQDISGFNVIFLAALGLKNRPEKFIKLLLIATWKQVYILDFTQHVKSFLPPLIKGLFENQDQVKVIHGASDLIESLQNTYGANLMNFYDTQEKDLLLRRKSNENAQNKSQSQCLNYYFNLPISVADGPVEIATQEQWFRRPLEELDLVDVAKMVAFLFLLRRHLRKLSIWIVFRIQEQFVKLQENNRFMSVFKRRRPGFTAISVERLREEQPFL